MRGKTIAWITVLLALTACGGGGGGSPTAPSVGRVVLVSLAFNALRVGPGVGGALFKPRQ
jgi:hypothetical protein